MLNHTFASRWTDAQGNFVGKASRTLQSQLSVVLDSSMPVPVGTAAGAEIDIAFPGIVTAASYVLIENQSGQELGMAWTGNFLPSIPDGGMVLWYLPTTPSQRQILSLRFFLTQDQVSPGSILYTVCGA